MNKNALTISGVIVVAIVVGLFAFGNSSENEADRELEDYLGEDGVDLLDEMSETDPEFAEDYEKAVREEIENEMLDNDIALEDRMAEIENNIKSGKNLVGSCDMIAEDSVCIEYFGSFWTRTMIEPSCDGVYSTKGCSAGMVGGCNTGAGTGADMVAWLYLSGGGEINEASIKNAKGACNMTMGSTWINN